jgi:hypothetical protein
MYRLNGLRNGITVAAKSILINHLDTETTGKAGLLVVKNPASQRANDAGGGK